MENGTYKGESFQYLGHGERRKFRPMANQLFQKDKLDKFPTDKKTVAKIKKDIIRFVVYCYKRICDKGYVEKEMIEEFRNIAIILRAYCEVENGELWDSDFNTFNIRFFEYLLKLGSKYDKNLVAKLLTQSEILNALGIYIIQYQDYIFDSNLILNYNDISVEAANRNMLCFMTHQVCPQIKKLIDVKVDNLTMEELEIGIRSGYFCGKEEEVNKLIRDRLTALRFEDSAGFNDFATKILKLHIMEYLDDISMYEDLIKGHDLYMLKYHPDMIDYSVYDIRNFIGIINLHVLNDVTEYGGYDFYKRVYSIFKKHREIKYTYILGHILKNERFRRIHYEEKNADSENCG